MISRRAPDPTAPPAGHRHQPEEVRDTPERPAAVGRHLVRRIAGVQKASLRQGESAEVKSRKLGSVL